MPFMDALYKRQDEIRRMSAITNKAALLRQSVLLGQVGNMGEFILQLPVPVL